MTRFGFFKGHSVVFSALLIPLFVLCSCEGSPSHDEDPVRSFGYRDYRFDFLDGGEGVLVDTLSGETILRSEDVSFDREALEGLEEGTPFVECVRSIGFPLSHGIESEGSLDFLDPDGLLYRVSFAYDDQSYLGYETLDPNAFETWVDAGKGRLPSLEEVTGDLLMKGIPEVVEILGKANGLTGTVVPCLYFFLEGERTYLTLWEKSPETGDWYMYAMSWMEGQEVGSGDWP